MANALGVHSIETTEDMPNVMLDMCNINLCLCLFSLFQDIFETTLTEFHHSILYNSFLGIKGVKEVKKLDNIRSTSEHRQNLILSGYDTSSLHSSFESNSPIMRKALCLEDVS